MYTKGQSMYTNDIHAILLHGVGTIHNTRRNIDRLEQINTKAARFITNNYTQAPGITTRLKQINMDPLHIHRQAHRLTLMYKITNNYIDIDPHTYLHTSNKK